MDSVRGRRDPQARRVGLQLKQLKTLIIAKLNARVTALTLNPTNFSDYRKVKKALTVGREIDYADAWSVVFRICCDKR
ncbi:hypothetical protein CGRA01v4_08921 [Colletotrichum graminicola]|nr:hypothetical protein CGRA01v4_08921 [Colletotrichum graminicola]